MGQRQTKVECTRELLNLTEGWLVRVKNKQGVVTHEEYFTDYEQALIAFNFESRSKTLVTERNLLPAGR